MHFIYHHLLFLYSWRTWALINADTIRAQGLTKIQMEAICSQLNQCERKYAVGREDAKIT